MAVFGERSPDAVGVSHTQPLDGQDPTACGDATIPLQADARTIRLRTPASPVVPVPRLSAGLERLGEYKGSGFTEPKYLVRRRDGQVVQLSRLLYLVVSAIDGTRDAEGISHYVSGRFDAEVTADNVVYLLDNKLTPLGVLPPPRAGGGRPRTPLGSAAGPEGPQGRLP